ncbi:MAG: hypothetical protein ACOX04_04170 [Candidatus Scatomorpha sp.]
MKIKTSNLKSELELEVEWEKKSKKRTDYYGQNGNELLANAYFESFCTCRTYG